MPAQKPFGSWQLLCQMCATAPLPRRAFEIIRGACFVCSSEHLPSGHASQAARASNAACAVKFTSADARARRIKSALDDVRETSDYFGTGAPLYKVCRMALGQHARQVLRRAGKT